MALFLLALVVLIAYAPQSTEAGCCCGCCCCPCCCCKPIVIKLPPPPTKIVPCCCCKPCCCCCGGRKKRAAEKRLSDESKALTNALLPQRDFDGAFRGPVNYGCTCTQCQLQNCAGFGRRKRSVFAITRHVSAEQKVVAHSEVVVSPKEASTRTPPLFVSF